MPAWNAFSSAWSIPLSAWYSLLRAIATMVEHAAQTASRAGRLGDGAELRLLVAAVLRHRDDPLEGGHAGRAELAARAVAQLLQRELQRPRGAVDPRRQHRVERVRDVDDPRAERDRLAGEPRRVAAPVEALVV